MIKYLYVGVFVLLLSALGFTSCKKYSDNPPYFEPYDSSLVAKDRRVLVIAIDGLQSDAFKTAATPNYTALMENGKYAWDAKSDIISKDASAWKTLMSGVTYSTHNISDSNFSTAQGSAGDHDDNGSTTQSNYPSFYYFILRSRIFNASTAFLSSWGKMVSSVANESKTKAVLNNDAAVKDSAIGILKNGNAKVVVVNFNGPAKLAVDPSSAANFSSGSAEYVASLKTVDGYIGEIMNTLKARPLYNSSEDWLVVITGTHGGVNKTYGGSSDGETLVPTLYYNKAFKKQEFTSAGSFSSIKVQSNTITASLNDPDDEYMPKTGQFSVQFKVRGSLPSYAHVFSKWNGAWASGIGGWSIFTSGSNWGLSIKSGTSGERRIQESAPNKNISDNDWHTLTFVFYDSASKRWVKRFTDGVRIPDGTNRDITGFGGGTIVSQGTPFTIAVQKDSYGGANFNIADIKVFKTALTDQEITSSLCTDYKATQFNNLIGFWPCNDGLGNIMTNKINTNKNFTLTGPFKWEITSNYPCTFTPNPPAGKTTLFLRNVDVSAQIFYWLQLPVPSTWSLEGNIWLTPFESEFIKI